MTEPVIDAKDGRLATITVNRTDKSNTLRPDLSDGPNAALEDANPDNGIRVIMLEGAGDSCRGGFDFSDGLEHFENAIARSAITARARPRINVENAVNRAFESGACAHHPSARSEQQNPITTQVSQENAT